MFNVDKKCAGCLSLEYDDGECKFTNMGTASILNCHCHSCLLKTVCTDMCDEFYKIVQLCEQRNPIIFILLEDHRSNDPPRLKKNTAQKQSIPKRAREDIKYG
jgi:hypothetical protein